MSRLKQKKGSEKDELAAIKKKDRTRDVFQKDGERIVGVQIIKNPKMPWRIRRFDDPHQKREMLNLKSETFVYEVRFEFADGTTQYPIVNNKMAAMLPNGFINSKFYAALIFVTSKLREKYYIVTSTLMTMSNLIVAGIKNEADLLDALFQLTIDLDNARLPIPRYCCVEVIDITVCNKYPSTVLINKIPEAATPGFKACFIWNFNLFPAEDVHVCLYPNSELRLEEHFSNRIILANLYKHLSIKLSGFKLNSCGGKTKQLIKYIHQLIYDYISDPENGFTVPNIVLDKKLLAAEQERMAPERATYERSQRLTAIADRNRRFKLFLDVYMRFIAFLKAKNRYASFCTIIA
jgi:hypothetical protein